MTDGGEMSDGTIEFLKDLGRRGHEPLLAKISGRARFEVVDGDVTDRWLVAIDNGNVVVSHKGGTAECVIRGEKALLDRLCRGEENAIAAVLRGALQCGGDVELLFAIQRVFPCLRREQRTSGAEAGT
jgi:predicted lipid carrier protein YhbT